MSDFLVQIGSAWIAERCARALRQRPFLGDRPLRRAELPWGAVLVQVAPGAGYEPAWLEGRFAAAIGRPRLIGVEHEIGGIAGFAERFLAMLMERPPGGVARSLTGMGVVLVADADGLMVVTDRMGARPVYAALSDTGTPIAFGSHLEALALMVGREADFDPVSLGELIVHHYVTHPYTSRLGIVELEPGSITRFRCEPATRTMSVAAYWVPREPDAFPRAAEIGEQLAAALVAAGEDVTRGASRVGVTLSGGRDSRAVMGLVPPDRLDAGLTYCTRENRETSVAARVAAAFGVPHVLVRRDPDFYAWLLASGTALLGTELRADAHGMCVAERGLCDRFDVVVGGQLSDTLLKDHFMPASERERLRDRAWREHARGLARHLLGRGSTPGRPVSGTLERARSEWVLRPEIRDAVRERRARRLDRLRETRPRTAEEWFRFWPASRQDDSSHTLGNSRLFASDTLFLHAAILEAARAMDPAHRVGGWLADRVFQRFYGASRGIECANTGLPIDTPAARIRAHARRMRRDPGAREAFRRLPASAHPWNDVQGSWVDTRALQELCPRWQRMRAAVLASDRAVALVSDLLSVPGAAVLGAYDDRLAPETNRMVMQIAWHAGGSMPGDSGVGAPADLNAVANGTP